MVTPPSEPQARMMKAAMLGRWSMAISRVHLRKRWARSGRVVVEREVRFMKYGTKHVEV